MAAPDGGSTQGPDGERIMLGVLAFIGAIFALIWSAVAATVVMVVVFALVIPLVLLLLFFRLGIGLIKVAVAVVLICCVAAWIV